MQRLFSNKKFRLVFFVLWAILLIGITRQFVFKISCNIILKNNPSVLREIGFEKGSSYSNNESVTLNEYTLSSVVEFLSDANYLSKYDLDFYDKYKMVKTLNSNKSITLRPVIPNKINLIQATIYEYDSSLTKIECHFRKEKSNLSTLSTYFIE